MKRDPNASESAVAAFSVQFDAVVVGAGFSGLYMTHLLRDKLDMSVRTFEAGTGVGGTWYWNTYPGARVDSPSLQYSFSFSSEMEQEWSWAEDFSPQGELEAYANHVADRFGLRRSIQFETTVTNASYDATSRRWLVTTDRGDHVAAKYLMAAVGCLSATNVPPFPGIDSFSETWYHTSRWPKGEVDFTGKRVGVIGTGSTGIQVIPMVAEQADQLYVFQRTPNYSLPCNNKPMDQTVQAEWKKSYQAHREAARHTPSGLDIPTFPRRSALSVPAEERNAIFERAWGNYTQLMSTFDDIMTNPQANELVAEFVRGKIRAKVKDPVTAELLTPKDYPIGAKRLCLDTNYYETYNKPNVTLVDVRADPIAEIISAGVRLRSGAKYGVDFLVFATGYDAMTGPLLRMNIVGKDGVRLADKWKSGPRTYLGLQTAGFPNLFMITGPGSPSVLSNMTTSIEQHVEWIAKAVQRMESNGASLMEPAQQAEDYWVEHVNSVANKTLFPLANSWYMGANIPGKVRIFMPYVAGVGTYRRKCEEIVADEYRGFEFTI